MHPQKPGSHKKTETETKPKSMEANHQIFIGFNEGTEVEVTSDEQGFRGSWYPATILESPPIKRKKHLVVYKTRLTEDASAPLTEYVDPGYIRPVPPDDPDSVKKDRAFEENDVVDARYRDRWWTGTVRKVLDGNRYRVFLDKPADVSDFDAKDLRVHWDWVFGEWFRAQNSSKSEANSSRRRKRGRPRKYIIISPKSPAGKEGSGAGDDINEMVVKDRTTNEVLFTQVKSTVSQNASGEKDIEAHSRRNETGMASAGVLKDVVDDDQPLSMSLGGIHSSASVEESRSSSSKSTNGCNETRETPDVKENSEQKGNTSLPFVKRSPVWKTIESMEVFRVIPQKPHFHPLAKCKEECREGSAIGMMVTFAGLFEKISSLHLDDSRSIFESILESLFDLEKHGFGVAMLQSRVTELLSIKDGQGELLNEFKDAVRELKVHIDEKRKLEEKMNDIERKIEELHEELVASKSKMGFKNLKTGRLQSHADAVKERLKNVHDTFAKAANAPWKIF